MVRLSCIYGIFWLAKDLPSHQWSDVMLSLPFIFLRRWWVWRDWFLKYLKYLKIVFKFRKPLWSTFQNFCVFQKKGDTPYCSLFQYYCLLQICFPKYWNTLLVQERWKTLISLTIERLRRLAIVVFWAGHWWVLQQCHLQGSFLAPISYLIGTNPVDKLDKGEQWGLIPSLVLGPLIRCFSQDGETCS